MRTLREAGRAVLLSFYYSNFLRLVPSSCAAWRLKLEAVRSRWCTTRHLSKPVAIRWSHSPVAVCMREKADMPLECRCGSSTGLSRLEPSPPFRRAALHPRGASSISLLSGPSPLSRSVCSSSKLCVCLAIKTRWRYWSRAEALCGFVGGCARGGRRFGMVVGRAQGLL